MGKTIIGALVVLLLVGAGTFLLLQDGTVQAPTTPEDTMATSTDTAPTGAALPRNAVAITAGLPGKSLTLSVVEAAQPSFVAIHRDDAGKPGKVIGVSALMATGTTESVAVTLTESVKVGDKLYAMLHTDDGDGAYEFPGADVPTMSADGMVVMTPFEIVATMPTTTPSGM